MAASELSRARFLARFGPVYEASPWVADGVWPAVEAGGLDDPASLAAAMRAKVDAAPRAMQLALIRAHPELASRTRMANASVAEQSAAGLDQCSADEFAAFQRLNRAYNARFGFPFIVAVKGMTRADILAAFENAARQRPGHRVRRRRRRDPPHRGLPPRRPQLRKTPSVFDDLRSRYVDLLQPRLGSEVVYATDDFFADKSRLIAPTEPQFIPGKYDDNGKWMDGWESRRKRVPGHDWCVIRLGVPGVISGFEIDTRHFTGNYPPAAEIEVCRSAQTMPGDDAHWVKVTDRIALNGDDRIYVPIEYGAATHVRLHIFPDGGVARLRAWGRVQPDWAKRPADEAIDLLALEHGGRGIIANDQHYGRVENLTAPGRGVDMSDGWETRRRREEGHDWAILELGALGVVEAVVVDTAHFKGNYPDRCSIQAVRDAEGKPETIAAEAVSWPILLREVKLAADSVATFRDELRQIGPVRFIRLNIVPDGGVSRLRVIGRRV